MSLFRFVGLGGTNEVGASASLYRIDQFNILIDAGIRAGIQGDSSLPSLELLESYPPDAIFLTHAHIDHSGALPIVHRMFPKAPILATKMTRLIAAKVLTDSAQVNKSSGHQLFTDEEVTKAIEAIKEITVGETINLPWGYVTPQVAGHVPGAVTFLLESNGNRVLHTGDFQNVGTSTTDPVYRPKEPLPVAAVVTESTYGDILLPNYKKQLRSIVETVGEILGRGGRVLIPSFAIGRAQEILLVLSNAMRGKTIPIVPIYLDGLTRDITSIYSANLDALPKSIQNAAEKSRLNPFLANNIFMVDDSTRLRLLENRKPMVIISSGRSLSSGISPLYARHILEEELSAMLAVGFKDAENPGARVLSRNKGDILELGIGGHKPKKVTIRADIKHYYLGTHADRIGVTSLLSSYPSNHVVLTHGSTNSRQSLKDALIGDRDVHTPSAGQWIDLLAPRQYGPNLFDKHIGSSRELEPLEANINTKTRLKTFGTSASLSISENKVILEFPTHVKLEQLLGHEGNVAVKVRPGEKFSMTVRPQDANPEVTTIEERMVYVQYAKKLLGGAYEAWLSKPNKLLDWSSPHELLRNRNDSARVIKVLEATAEKEQG